MGEGVSSRLLSYYLLSTHTDPSPKYHHLGFKIPTYTFRYIGRSMDINIQSIAVSKQFVVF
jgi:hypothetical protein